VDGREVHLTAAKRLHFRLYQQRQNDFRTPPTCSASAGFRSFLRGTLNEVALCRSSLHKRFDGFAELRIPTERRAGHRNSSCRVPYNSDNNFAPTIGGRFSF